MGIKKIIWVKTKEEAVEAVKDFSLVLYAILGFKSIGAIMRGLIPLEIMLLLLLFGMVFGIQKRKSKVCAVILILLIVPGEISAMVLSFLQLVKMVSAQNPQITQTMSILGRSVLGYLTQIALIVCSIGLTRAVFIFHKIK